MNKKYTLSAPEFCLCDLKTAVYAANHVARKFDKPVEVINAITEEVVYTARPKFAFLLSSEVEKTRAYKAMTKLPKEVIGTLAYIFPQNIEKAGIYAQGALSCAAACGMVSEEERQAILWKVLQW